MSLLLADAFEHESLKAAEPVLRTDVPEALSRQLRWVHSSEVLDIAPLLRGGELLLSGGQALATASDERRVDYVRQLAARGITALAIETGPELPAIPESMLDAGQDAGLPIIELCKVAPFVGIMQAINSLLVSESVAQLQFGDETSHAMAAELAHGGGLDQLLAVLASRTGAGARLVSPSGITLGSATAAVQPESCTVTTVDVPVRGVLAARLELEVPDDGDANLARVAGERCVDILGLALLQRMPPGLKELAGGGVMRAISSGIRHGDSSNWDPLRVPGQRSGSRRRGAFLSGGTAPDTARRHPGQRGSAKCELRGQRRIDRLGSAHPHYGSGFAHRPHPSA